MKKRCLFSDSVTRYKVNRSKHGVEKRTSFSKDCLNYTVAKRCKLVLINNDLSKKNSAMFSFPPVYTSLVVFLHVTRNILCHQTKVECRYPRRIRVFEPGWCVEGMEKKTESNHCCSWSIWFELHGKYFQPPSVRILLVWALSNRRTPSWRSSAF